MTTITLQQVKDEANKVVEQFGHDHRNPGVGEDLGCFYTHPREGGHCIAGQIGLGLGLPVPGVNDALNDENVSALAATNWEGLLDVDAVDWLIEAQSAADLGDSWGQAVLAANSLT